MSDDEIEAIARRVAQDLLASPELARSLQRWGMEPGKTAAYGSEARRRCLERFSSAVMGKNLLAAMEELAASDTASPPDGRPVG
ncbi:MAG: hypothetical protein GX608_07655 [Lentisphaerae bacterium]|nr:hypothetical protein [Lentisphaerota bacterium]